MLEEIFERLNSDETYLDLVDDADKFVYETLYLISEMLNPDNAYIYNKLSKNHFSFFDRFNVQYVVVLTYMPTDEPYFEFKIGYIDPINKKIKYDKEEVKGFDDKRSDTIAKIFRDEILLLFKNQKLSDIMKIIPKNGDIKRYMYSLRLIKKFIPTSYEIDESQKPELIIIKRK